MEHLQQELDRLLQTLPSADVAAILAAGLIGWLEPPHAGAEWIWVEGEKPVKASAVAGFARILAVTHVHGLIPARRDQLRNHE